MISITFKHLGQPSQSFCGNKFPILRNRMMCSTMMNLFYVYRQTKGRRAITFIDSSHTHLKSSMSYPGKDVHKNIIQFKTQDLSAMTVTQDCSHISCHASNSSKKKLRIRFQMSSFLQNIEVNCTNFNNIFAAFLSWAGWSLSSLPFLTPCSGIIFES